MDWAENVCLDPDILAKEMEHLKQGAPLQQLPTMVD